MEQAPEAARETFLKEVFAREGVASAFLYKALCELPQNSPSRNFAIRHLATGALLNLPFPQDLTAGSSINNGFNLQERIEKTHSIFSLRSISPSSLLINVDVNKLLYRVGSFFKKELKIEVGDMPQPLTPENFVLRIGGQDYMDMGRDEYVDWAWNKFQEFSHAKRGGLIVYLKSVSGQKFITETELISNGMPNLKNTGRKFLRIGAGRFGVNLTDLRGWGYELQDSNISDTEVKSRVAQDLQRYGIVERVKEYNIGSLNVQFFEQCIDHSFYDRANEFYPADAGTSYHVISLKDASREKTTIITSLERIFLLSLAKYGYIDQNTIARDYKPTKANDMAAYISRINEILSEVSNTKIVGNLAKMNIPGHLLDSLYSHRSKFIKKMVAENVSLFSFEPIEVQGFRVVIITPKEGMDDTLPYTPKIVSSGEVIPNLMINGFACDATKLGIKLVRQLSQHSFGISFYQLAEEILGSNATGTELLRLKNGYNRIIQLFLLAQGGTENSSVIPESKGRKETLRHYKEDPVIFPNFI